MKRTVLFLFFSAVFFNGYSQVKAVHVESTGQGQVVIFLPGFTNPGSIWEEFIPALDGEIEAHMVSYAGFNGMEPIDFPWYPKLKEGIKQYITHQNLQNIILIGHSMGGNLAIDLAAELPQRVSRLILVDTLPCMRELMFPGFTAEQMVYESPFNQQTLSMSDIDFKNMALGMASQMSRESSRHKQLAEWIQIADRKTYVYGYTDLLKLDQRDSLKNISAPTLVFGALEPFGEQAKINLNKQYASLANKTLIMIPESRHFIQFDQRELLAERINQFLNE